MIVAVRFLDRNRQPEPVREHRAVILFQLRRFAEGYMVFFIHRDIWDLSGIDNVLGKQFGILVIRDTHQVNRILRHFEPYIIVAGIPELHLPANGLVITPVLAYCNCGMNFNFNQIVTVVLIPGNLLVVKLVGFINEILVQHYMPTYAKQVQAKQSGRNYPSQYF